MGWRHGCSHTRAVTGERADAKRNDERTGTSMDGRKDGRTNGRDRPIGWAIGRTTFVVALNRINVVAPITIFALRLSKTSRLVGG